MASTTHTAARNVAAPSTKKFNEIQSLVGSIKSSITSSTTKLRILKAKRQSKIIKPDTIAERLSLHETLKQAVEDLAAEDAAAVGGDVVDASDVEHPLLPFGSDLSIASFETGSSLGRGKFGHVFLARHRTTNYICALKIIYKAQIADSKEEMLIRRELEIHQNLAHPNILRFLSWFHDDTRVFLVLEYAPGGNLNDLLLKQPQHRLNERYAAQYIAQTAEALRYMHNKNVMHRDIKPENILLGLHNEIKLADFGYSMHSISGLRSTVCGTLDYISPEVAIMHIKPGKAKEFYNKAVYQWSLGILTYELLVGKPPFKMKQGKATEKKIANFNGKINFLAHVSQPAIDFILKLLSLDADKRISLEDVLAHPWIEQHL